MLAAAARAASPGAPEPAPTVQAREVDANRLWAGAGGGRRLGPASLVSVAQDASETEPPS
jgi:hypothetical protein